MGLTHTPSSFLAASTRLAGGLAMAFVDKGPGPAGRVLGAEEEEKDSVAQESVPQWRVP